MQNEMLSSLSGKRVVLGVCSSIALYKSLDLASALVKAGADLRVVMTENACRLVSPRLFQTVARGEVYTSMWKDIADWKPEHISLAEFADLFLVAPATANTIGNFANGLAPDMMASLFLAVSPKKVMIAPAMNCDMYEHPAVVKNIETLKAFGVDFIEPDYGALACGTQGKGRLAELKTILDAICKKLEGSAQ